MADDIRARIASGEFPPGSQLPTGKELAVSYDVATNTVLSALRTLRADGLIASQQGRGTFVRRPDGGDVTVSTHQRLADELRAAIAEGRVAVGAPLPSTRQLMAEHNASNVSVRAALDQLRDEGLVVGQPGTAVYVLATPASVARERAVIETLRHDLQALRAAVDELVTSGTGKATRDTPDAAGGSPAFVVFMDRLDTIEATVRDLAARLHRVENA